MCKVQPVEQPKGAPFWSPILLTMSMTVATTPTIAITIVTGINAFMDVASNVDKSPTLRAKMYGKVQQMIVPQSADAKPVIVEKKGTKFETAISHRSRAMFGRTFQYCNGKTANYKRLHKVRNSRTGETKTIDQNVILQYYHRKSVTCGPTFQHSTC